jgi:2,3-bisphosphoglycerate-independent phosphoglycerate mutase
MDSESRSLLLFFIDGLGIGTRGPHNPFDGLDEAAPLANFQDEPARLHFLGILIPTDATFGVEGRPQSASGQPTILTGVNAPAAIGSHKQGFPNQALLDIIRAHSIFLQLKNRGVDSVTFANTYTDKFFERRPRWISATTAAVKAAGLRFNVVDDLRAGRAVYHDFTNAMLIERGEVVEPRTPEPGLEQGPGLCSVDRLAVDPGKRKEPKRSR